MPSNLHNGIVSVAFFFVCSLTGCGGGSGSGEVPPPAPAPPQAPIAPTEQQRVQAATQTAQNNSLCTAIQPFYWEIGDANSMRAGGTAGGTSPTSATPMLIASASKWIFGAYVA